MTTTSELPPINEVVNPIRPPPDKLHTAVSGYRAAGESMFQVGTNWRVRLTPAMTRTH